MQEVKVKTPIIESIMEKSKYSKDDESYSIVKKGVAEFISNIVKNMAEITNSKKNVKKNKFISTPFKLITKLFLIFKFQK